MDPALETALAAWLESDKHLWPGRDASQVFAMRAMTVRAFLASQAGQEYLRKKKETA